ncbi:DUF4397 domain-containing protein [Pedobacter sp. KBS0701]|uniref:DUF4397 domain-containing protein n=1 Tax=Pedobacter sp. KBS0701 TaxID=2578106 RepID=UPI00110F4C09|nr:DUF4397 domain-containing protein [Pedobacter sp. KBS0701]QDW27251.1 DUF4397 domain-containing protein [Pedobacter sp. KBS0701]
MKKYLNKTFFAFAVIFLTVSGCKEDPIEITPIASLNVSNVVIGGNIVRLNDYLRDSCSVMNYYFFTLKAGNSMPLKLYASSTPNAPYFNENKDIESGGLYSLFLGGTPFAPESVWVKDNIQPYPTEDVIRIRLVNMSPNSSALSLTIGNAPTVNIFSGVVYKQVTEFSTQSFPAILPPSGNIFQIRDVSGNLLASYTMPATGTISQQFSRRRNLTLVVKGLIGGNGSNAFGILPVANYLN